jgi:hypothetical protein
MELLVVRDLAVIAALASLVALACAALASTRE